LHHNLLYNTNMADVMRRGFEQLKRSGRNIWNKEGAAEAAVQAGLEPFRLGAVGVGSIMGWTFGKMKNLLLGTLKLTGKALLTIPFIPVGMIQGSTRGRVKAALGHT